jgi:hypothetical protein
MTAVASLSGALLDYWAAKADGIPERGWQPPYSDDWTYGGPIIEREGISVMEWEIPNDAGMNWSARNLTANIHMDGPTPLIAAMRAYVASKFGDEVPDKVSTVHGQR